MASSCQDTADKAINKVVLSDFGCRVFVRQSVGSCSDKQRSESFNKLRLALRRRMAVRLPFAHGGVEPEIFLPHNLIDIGTVSERKSAFIQLKASELMMRVSQTELKFSIFELFQYLAYRVPFARIVHDKSVLPLLGRLEGKVLEIGAGVIDYSIHARKSDEYIRSDYNPPIDDKRIRIDATNIDFSDHSFDSVVCMSTMEHVEDFRSAFDEIFRVLKPGGRLLLCVPWLFPFHGAPDDYHRFTSSALLGILKKYEIEKFEAVGNFWISQAMFLQRPIWSRSTGNQKFRFYDPFLRMIGLLFILAGKNRSDSDDNYALLYSCLCRKPLA